jgi:hypothetical protein
MRSVCLRPRRTPWHRSSRPGRSGGAPHIRCALPLVAVGFPSPQTVQARQKTGLSRRTFCRPEDATPPQDVRSASEKGSPKHVELALGPLPQPAHVLPGRVTPSTKAGSPSPRPGHVGVESTPLCLALLLRAKSFPKASCARLALQGAWASPGQDHLGGSTTLDKERILHYPILPECSIPGGQP